MPITIRSEALRHMSADDKGLLLDAAFSTAPDELTSYLLLLDAHLREFEHRYELPSAELDQALETGELRDTAEVSKWLFLSELRSRLAREARP